MGVDRGGGLGPSVSRARARGVVCGRWRVRGPVPDEEKFFSVLCVWSELGTGARVRQCLTRKKIFVWMHSSGRAERRSCIFFNAHASYSGYHKEATFPFQAPI